MNEIAVICTESLENECLTKLAPLCGKPTGGPIFLSLQNLAGKRLFSFRTERDLTFDEAYSLALEVVGANTDEIQITLALGRGFVHYPSGVWLTM